MLELKDLKNLSKEFERTSLLYKFCYYDEYNEDFDDIVKFLQHITSIQRIQQIRREMTTVIKECLNRYGKFQWPDNSTWKSYSLETVREMKEITNKFADSDLDYIPNARTVAGIEKVRHGYKVIYAESDGDVSYMTAQCLTARDTESGFFILCKLIENGKF